MKKIMLMLLAVLGCTAVSAQTKPKATDNNVRIPNEDIIRISAQRPRTENTAVVIERDTTRRVNTNNRANTNINANTVNENSNAIKVDVHGQANGVASPIGSEPVGTQTTTPGSTVPKQ